MRKEGPAAFDGSRNSERMAKKFEEKRAARLKKIHEAYAKEYKDLRELRAEWKARMDNAGYLSSKWEAAKKEYQAAEDSFWASSINPLRRGPVNYMLY